MKCKLITLINEEEYLGAIIEHPSKRMSAQPILVYSTILFELIVFYLLLHIFDKYFVNAFLLYYEI